MKRAAVAGVLSICIFLSGCGILDSKEYVWMDTHPVPTAPQSNQSIFATDYASLYAALIAVVEEGSQQATISVERYNQNDIEGDLQLAIETVRSSHPIAAYAVENITYTLGTANGERVIALNVAYLHGQAEIKRIKPVENVAAAEETVAAALVACETGVVLQIMEYAEKDWDQFVKDYALLYPEVVMEVPQVTVNVFPETGATRVVELKFGYQTSRDSLKDMQAQVSNLFKSAQFFASGYYSDNRRFMRLYSWLMETNQYTIQTSITPAYSLLRYGIGDSRAFSTVYAALCRQMELECITVFGTKNGESWCWNLVCIEGAYYHVDLLQCSRDGGFTPRVDSQMEGYVWDYNAYPDSPDPVPETTEPPATASPT